MISTLLSVQSVFSYIGYVLIAILVLLVMITIHEFGHFVAGRLLGFKINEFSVGFGPALFSKTNKKNTKISLRLIPLGGYCAFEGEDADSSNPQAFNNQKPWKRLIVLFMGAFFNFLSAIIFSFILLLSVGYADRVEISSIKSQDIVSSSSSYNLAVGDVVLAVNGVETDFFKDNYFSTLIADFKENEDFTVTVKRLNNQTNKSETIDIVLHKVDFAESGQPAAVMLGVELVNHKYSFVEALVRCVPFAFYWAIKVIVLLFYLITGKLALSSVGGPITTIGSIATLTQTNWKNLLILFPLISSNLAAFNLLPIPALDGSRMVFVLIEWIRKKPISRKVENAIHSAGLIILFALVIFIDVFNLIK